MLEVGSVHRRSALNPSGPPRRNHAAVQAGAGDDQVQPPVEVEVGQGQPPGRDVVPGPFQHREHLGRLQVEAARSAAVDVDLRPVEMGDHEVEVAVAVEVGHGGEPAVARGDDQVGIVAEAIRPAAVEVGAGVEVDGVLPAVDEQEVRPAVVVDGRRPGPRRCRGCAARPAFRVRTRRAPRSRGSCPRPGRRAGPRRWRRPPGAAGSSENRAASTRLEPWVGRRTGSPSWRAPPAKARESTLKSWAVRCWQITRSQAPSPLRSASTASQARWVGTARRASSENPPSPPK